MFGNLLVNFESNQLDFTRGTRDERNRKNNSEAPAYREHGSEVRANSFVEARDNMQITAHVQDLNRLAINHNRVQGSKSWSVERSDTSQGSIKELQLISEIKIEGAYHLQGPSTHGRLRVYRDVATYVGWFSNHDIRNNISTSPLRPSSSNRLHKKILSMETEAR